MLSLLLRCPGVCIGRIADRVLIEVRDCPSSARCLQQYSLYVFSGNKSSFFSMCSSKQIEVKRIVTIVSKMSLSLWLQLVLWIFFNILGEGRVVSDEEPMMMIMMDIFEYPKRE